MTKIQIIIDEDNSIKVINCSEVEIEHPSIVWSHDYDGTFSFTAQNVILDESPGLISLPDDLLVRLRDYNLDTKHQLTIEKILKLERKKDLLETNVAGLTEYRDGLLAEISLYSQALHEIIGEYPQVAAEVALKLGDLDAACYFAEKGKEKENV